MAFSRLTIVIGVVGTLWLGERMVEASPADARLVAAPAITKGKIAFLYGGDVWIAQSDGSNPRRLTSHPGDETAPSFSPDGSLVAFSAAYDGNVDVYVIPVEGGEPRRLTWHPGDDVARGFTPEGKVLFSSQRGVSSRRHSRLYTVDPKGGAPEVLPVPSADKGAISPDGKFLAYTPLREAFHQWKNYRGGTASRIWVLKLADLSRVEIPKPHGGCNDTEPMWLGGQVYFLSDRDGEFNLYSYDPSTTKVAKHTGFTGFPIASASAGDGKVIHEQAGWIHVHDPGDDRSTRLRIPAAGDFAETRPRLASGAKYLRGSSVSPTGKRVAIEFRGEIVTVATKKGDPRDLTESPGAHDRSPAWSPDGGTVAYFSDATGEYVLVVRPADGKGAGKEYPLKGAGFYEKPRWSPDGSRIAYIDNARALFELELTTGTVKRIAAEAIYGPVKTLSYDWSPDSRWLAYTLTNKVGFQTLWLYGIEKGESHSVTGGLVEAGSPAFDAGGEFLYFLASTDAGPVKNWFELSFTDIRASSTIYLVALARKTPNPLLKENDEESQKPPSKSAKESEADAKVKTEAAIKKTTIDLDGLGERIVALPVDSGTIEGLEAGSEGQLYYIRRAHGGGRGGTNPSKGTLKRYDLKKHEEETLAEGIDDFEITADRKRMLYQTGNPESPPGQGHFVMGVVDTGKFNPGDGAVKLDDVAVKVDPRREWAEILREAWRINRDYFYAPNMHGADWDAVLRKYQAFLPELTCRGDLSRVIQMMLSELAVGHSYQTGGERLYEPKPIPVGLLGADYEVADGRFRFKTVYGGAYWDPSLRSPLSAPGVDVRPGDYLLAVQGRDLKADGEVYRPFEATVGKRIELKVGPSADGSNSRTVVVEPIGDESGLRNRAWVEGNLRKVHERTNGRAAYVYVPNTGQQGYSYFKRYFFPQGDKDAIIVDERYNGGGEVADYYIELLRRPLVSYWATRYGEPLRTPNAAIMGPKVMIIDETAGSGGDLLPWMFRKFGLGTLVGRRTWGGLVGILGFPELMDGGRVTAPDLAIFTKDGWIVENEGIAPDVEVEQDPAAVAAGRDPQLDRAIEIVLEQLAKAPAEKVPARPPYPVKVRRESGVAASPAKAGGEAHANQ